MKTAISIPDNLFFMVERVSKQLGITRSRLFAKAVEEFIAKYSDDDILEKLNNVYSENDSKVAEDIINAQYKVMSDDDSTW